MSRYLLVLMFLFVAVVPNVVAQDADPYLVETEFFPMAIIVGNDVIVFGQESWNTPILGGGSYPKYFSIVLPLDEYVFYANQSEIGLRELHLNPSELVNTDSEKLEVLVDSTYYHTQFSGGYSMGEVSAGIEMGRRAGFMLYISNSWKDGQIVYSEPEELEAEPCVGMTFTEIRAELDEKVTETSQYLTPFEYTQYVYGWPQPESLALNWLENHPSANVLAVEYPIAGCALIAQDYDIAPALVHANLYFGDYDLVDPELSAFGYPAILQSLFGDGIELFNELQPVRSSQNN